MARYSAGMTAAGAGTSLRPIFGLLSTASITGIIREIMLFNTTGTACTYEVVRFTGGTAGATVANTKHRTDSATSSVLAKQLWTADATIVDHTGDFLRLGAADGSGAIITFGEGGLESALGATAGIGLVPVGTGQVCTVKITWDE